MSALVKGIRFYQQQMDFLDSKAPIRGFCAGVGSGKTSVGAFDLINRGKPGRLYMVVLPNYGQGALSTVRAVAAVSRDLGVLESAKYGEPPEMTLKNGVELVFRSGDQPESLYGPNLSGLWMDEASLQDRRVFEIGLGRLREGGERGWMSCTFTPKGTLNWTFDVFGKEPLREGVELFHARTGDNPFNFAGFAESMAPFYTKHLQQQEIGGLFVDEGGERFTPKDWPRYEFVPSRWGQFKVGPNTYDVPECASIAAVDWAATAKETSDRTCVVGGVVTPNQELLIPEVRSAKIPIMTSQGGPDELLAKYCLRWKPSACCSDDDVLSKTMKVQCARHAVIPSIQLVPIQGRDKLKRAHEAIMEGESGRIWLPVEAPWLDEFCAVLIGFTGRDKKERDDEVDALGLLVRLSFQFRSRPTADVPEIITMPAESSRWRITPHRSEAQERLYPWRRR